MSSPYWSCLLCNGKRRCQLICSNSLTFDELTIGKYTDSKETHEYPSQEREQLCCIVLFPCASSQSSLPCWCKLPRILASYRWSHTVGTPVHHLPQGAFMMCTCFSSFLMVHWSSVYCCRDSVCTASWHLLHSLHFLSSYEYQATEQVLCSLLNLRDMQKLCFTFIKLISGSLR